MATYGKASWSRLQIEEGLDEFKDKISNINRAQGFIISALMADLQIHGDKTYNETFGLNPVNAPRMDRRYIEDLQITNEQIPDLFAQVMENSNEEEISFVDGEFEPGQYFGTDYSLNDSWFGFWFVMRESKNLEDSDSQKEELSNFHFHKPFKLLKGEDRKTILSEMDQTQVWAERKQFLVLINKDNGRVYVSSTNKKHIQTLGGFLQNAFGTKIKATTLTMGPSELPWQIDFFNKLMTDNIISGEMDDILDAQHDEEKLQAMRTNYPIVDFILKKKSLLAEYSDDSYLLQVHVPATMSPDGVTAAVSAGDSVTAYEVYKKLGWGPVQAEIQAKTQGEQLRWKTEVVPANPVTHVFKNVELSKHLINDSIDEKILKEGEYKILVAEYAKCLSQFENAYIGLLKRVLGIDENEASVGIFTMNLEQSEETVSDVI